MFEVKLSSDPSKPKYKWNYFLDSFKQIKSYNASTIKSTIKNSKGKPEQVELPVVTIVFNNKFRAKVFIYWLQALGNVEKYQAAVFLDDTVPEVYERAK